MDRKTEEKVIKARNLFTSLPKEIQVKELVRYTRIVNGVKAILVTPIDDPNKTYRFNNPKEVVNWLRYNGQDNASTSNLYKVLKRKRKSAYGYLIEYEK